MINWITNEIGTGPFLEVIKKQDEFVIVDVRNLVDREGNQGEIILEKIKEGLASLNQNKRIVVCCDYGMSRSNSIAAGIISMRHSISFSESVKLIQKKVSEKGIKLEVLESVFRALNKESAVINENSQRILMTGGSGFIGSMLTQELTNSYFLKSLSSKDVDLVHNPVLLDLLVKENGISTILHLANPRVYTLNIAMGESLVMLRNILEVCRINSVRLVYVSSWEVYSGYQSEELIADETLPLFPKGAYGESKWMAEELIKHYSKVHGLKYTILRSSPVYGEKSDRPKFIYNFIDRAKRNEKITTHRYINGFPKLDLLDVRDFVAAMKSALEQKESQIFNLGSGRLISTFDIAKIIVKAANSTSQIESTAINTYYSNIKMDFAKASKLLGWNPSFDFEKFITRTVR